MNAVAAGLCSDIQNRIADPRGFAEKDLILAHQAERESIDQRIQRVSIIERNFAADRGHAKRVAVVRDPGHDPGE